MLWKTRMVLGRDLRAIHQGDSHGKEHAAKEKSSAKART